ncbi:MAG: hemerythrin domain-containing protein [Actinobacteria bacterium]|nr:hemerythrin domain-containing protein [Actinomycetota bacterium]
MQGTSDESDIRDMLAVHDAFRAELAELPDLVLAVTPGDSERTGIVGEHTLLVLSMLEAHHDGEDVLVWPLVRERAPEAVDLVAALEAQHLQIHPLIDAAREDATAWMATCGQAEAGELAGALAALDQVLRAHLAQEESEFMPIMARTMTQEEWAAVGVHSRAALAPEQLGLALGTILADTSPELGELIIGSMPPEGQAGWEQFGKPAYASYRARLYGEPK